MLPAPRVHLRHVTLEGPRYEFALKALIPDFERAEHSLSMTVDGWPYERIAFGEELRNPTSPYDVFSLTSYYVPVYAETGEIIPLDEYVNDEAMGIREKEDYWDLAWEIHTYEGADGEKRTYGVPTDINALIMYYRSDILEANGFRPPETLDEVKEIARATTDRPNQYGFITQLRPWYSAIFWITTLWDYGGDVLDRRTWDVICNSEEGLRAIELTAFLHENFGVPGETAFDRFAFNDYMANRGLGVLSPYMYGNGVPQNPNLSRLADVIRTSRPPGGPGGRFSPIGGVGCCVSRKSKHPREAFRWIEFQQRRENMKKLVEATGQPGRRSALKDPDIQRLPNARHFHALVETCEHDARTMWARSEVYEVISAVGEEVYSHITGEETAEAALAKMERRISKIMW